MFAIFSSAVGCIQLGRQRGRALMLALTLAWCSVQFCGNASAQSSLSGILQPGQAAVTGFSGVIRPAQIPLSAVPATRTFIDLDGPSARIVDLASLGSPVDGPFVNAPKPYAFTAAQLGQVFSVALDNQTPPNIFLAATSAYGLPIVSPGLDGQMVHARKGQPLARFMPGLWGPPEIQGGPGSIWKINGVTGTVTLFANVELNGAPTAQAALGGLAYHQASGTLFVTARDTGMIHGFSRDGREIHYDHGTQARYSIGQPPVAFDVASRVDIKSPAFDSEDPTTWGYAVPERRIFGLGIFNDRLFYAVAAGPQIWSVGITNDGTFSQDPTLELSVSPGAGPVEISKIIFDDDGRMLLAERPAPVGSFDFNALTAENTGRVLRYTLIGSAPGAPRVWQPVPDEYAVGFPPGNQNGNGGIAIGYDYGQDGTINRHACGAMLWMTGERLRFTSDSTLAARLAATGPANVDGLQGSELWRVVPRNVPPLASVFIDYDDRFDNPNARGYMGDLAILRVCGPFIQDGWMLPDWWRQLTRVTTTLQPLPPSPPSQSCPADQLQIGIQCCPHGSVPDASGQCKSWCPSGANDPKSLEQCGLGFNPETYDPANVGLLKCLGGGAPSSGGGILGCAKYSPVLSAAVCPAGWSKQTVLGLGPVCKPDAQQAQCLPGHQVSPINGKCHVLCGGGVAWPVQRCCTSQSQISVTGACCPAGTHPNPATGSCCPEGSKFDVKTGQCAPVRRLPPPVSCAPGQQGKDGTCCKPGWTPNKLDGGCCQPGQEPNRAGLCRWQACAAPSKQVGVKCCTPQDLKAGGVCAIASCIPTGAGNFCCDSAKVYKDRSGVQACCLTGKVRDGQCSTDTAGGTPDLPKCGSGANDPSCCAAGYQFVGAVCCLASQITSDGVCCPAGLKPSGANKGQCRPDVNLFLPPGTDGGGGISVSTGYQCCAGGYIPTASGVCCRPDTVTSTGVCCRAGERPSQRDPRTCEPDPKGCGIRESLVDGTCCPIGNIFRDSDGTSTCCGQPVGSSATGCSTPPLPSSPPAVPGQGIVRLPTGPHTSRPGAEPGQRSIPVPAHPSTPPIRRPDQGKSSAPASPNRHPAPSESRRPPASERNPAPRVGPQPPARSNTSETNKAKRPVPRCRTVNGEKICS